MYAITVLRDLAIGLVKLSILFFYRRIFTGPKLKIVNCFVIAVTAAWTALFTFVDVFDCGAAKNNLNGHEKLSSGGFDEKTENLSQVVTDIVLDLLMIAIPIPIVGLRWCQDSLRTSEMLTALSDMETRNVAQEEGICNFYFHHWSIVSSLARACKIPQLMASH